MKPINVVVYSAAIFFVIVGSVLILGWTTRREPLLMIGKWVFAAAIVVSCIPLIALGLFGFWMKVKHLFFRHTNARKRGD